jgi:cytidine deaminase
MSSIDDVEPLTGGEREELLRAASAVAENAYAPYSNFRVGTAVLGERATYIGVNVENASYGLAICAERSALAAAIAAGEKKIRGIAIACVDTSADSSAGLPCGACRQWILELAPRAEILILGKNRSFRIEELLPRPFQSHQS